MLKARREISLTAACLAFAAALSNPAAGQGIEANRSNWYFTPHLVEDHNPPLCQALERAVVGRFFTSKELDNLEDEPALNGPDIDWVIKRKDYEYQSSPSDDVGYDFDVFTLVGEEGKQIHLALHDLGLSIDEPNVFGKTPLMYAAQFDLLETARLLLDLGADPRAVTTESPECTTAVKIQGRSALTYAAENASEAMIRLLLREGADPLARDTIGRGFEDYLTLNRRLGVKQRRKLANLGQALAPE